MLKNMGRRLINDNEVKGITVADQVGEITSNDPFDYKYYVTVPYQKTTLHRLTKTPRPRSH